MKKHKTPTIDDGRKDALAVVLEMKDRARELAAREPCDKFNEGGRIFEQVFAFVEKKIRDGSPYRMLLIDSLLQWELLQGYVRDQILKAGQSQLRSRKIANEVRRRNPTSDKRYAILKPILDDTEKLKEANDRIAGLPVSKRRQFATLPMPRGTFDRYLARHRKQNKLVK